MLTLLLVDQSLRHTWRSSWRSPESWCSHSWSKTPAPSTSDSSSHRNNRRHSWGETMRRPGCSAQCSPADGTDDPGGGEMAGPRVEQGEAGGGGQQVGLQARGGEE